jgi:hypothetical protein
MLTGCRPTPQDAADAALAYLAEVLDAQRGPLQDRSHWELDALAQEFDRRA